MGDDIKITPEESDMLLRGGRQETPEAAENVSKLDTPGGKGNYALQEAQKKADMKEGLRKLIMSAIKDATEERIRSGTMTIETLKALPEAIRVYLSLSEDVPDRSIEEIRSNKDNDIIATNREDFDRLSRKLSERLQSRP